MIFSNYPLEEVIIGELKKNNYNVNMTTEVIFNKYPFFKKQELRKVIAKILEKIAGKQKIEGFWIKIGKNWELISKNKLRAIYLPSVPDESTNVGRANRFYLTPQGYDPDKAKNMELPFKETIQDVYERMYKRYKEELNSIDSESINKILLEELATLGYGQEELRKIKFLKD